MIQERAPERALKEIIGQRIIARPFPHGQLRSVVISHDQAARIGYGREPVVAATVDLLLVLVELVDEIVRRRLEGCVDRCLVDPKWSVRLRRHHEGVVLAWPEGRETRERRPVVVDLRGCRGVGDAVRIGEEAIQIVETAVLGVDHDDRLDVFERALRCRGSV